MAKFTVSANNWFDVLKGWSSLLRNLTFTDNFKGYEWTGEIAAGDIVQITHPLKVTPTRFIITDIFQASTPVIRPDTPIATDQFFYVTSASNFKGKILIMA